MFHKETVFTAMMPIQTILLKMKCNQLSMSDYALQGNLTLKGRISPGEGF